MDEKMTIKQLTKDFVGDIVIFGNQTKDEILHCSSTSKILEVIADWKVDNWRVSGTTKSSRIIISVIEEEDDANTITP